MIAHVLSAAGLDPTMVIGGRVRSLGTNAKMGQGEFMVAEADESDGSFLFLAPTIAVVTNIDREHMDYHQTMERLTESFLNFVNKIPFYGLAVLCLDNPQVQTLFPKVKKRCVTYGLSADADFTAQELKMSGSGVEFAVVHRGRSLGTINLRLLGRHSATNALAVVAVAQELEIPFARVAEALAEFTGIHRRFEVKGEAGGVMVIDDYGHHPAEVRATVGAIRDSWKRPLTVVFQPHRYSRTQDLFDDFVTAFDGADRLILTDIYAAGEDAITGVSSESLYHAIRKQGHLEVLYIAARDDVIPALRESSKEGDIVLTLGAGDVYKIGEALVAAL
jgi:UDP-N-acetylmuramate--alanine ligase